LAYLANFEQRGTHRLIPVEFAGKTDALKKLSLHPHALTELSQLAAVTDDRKQAEQGGALSIGPGELLQGVPEADVVNSAFCYPGTHGGRFHDSRRGAWYAGVEIESSLAEVAFHKRRFVEDARFSGPVHCAYQDFLADFSGAFSHLDDGERTVCLVPQPVPQCYGPGQALANALLYAGSNGIVYPSVRNPGGTCIACFRPALVFHPRRGSRYHLTVEAGVVWDGALEPL